LGSKHNQMPRVITVDKNPAYPIAIHELKNDRILPKNVGLRQIKYLNNIVEQDHRPSATRKAVSEITDNSSPFRLGCPYRSMSSW
jgi:transposase-like protein